MQRCEITLNTGGGVDADGGDITTLNSIIAQNGSAGSTVGGVQLAPSGNTVTFSNNTVVDNSINGSVNIGGVICDIGSGAVLQNSIIYGNDGSQSNSHCIVNYSFLLDGSASGSENITTGQPGFVDFGQGDYHLATTSDCIDAGDPATDPGTIGDTDIDGENRFHNQVDIGADETQ
jgi:hypothetical protein